MNLQKTRILILDDSPEALEQSRRTAMNFVPEANITATTGAAEAMRLIEEQAVDLVFLDVEMQETNGFSVAGFIDGKKNGVKYVFLTGHAEFAMDSYDYNPIDFLTKPIDIVRMRRTFEKFEAAVSPVGPSKRRIAIDTNGGLVLFGARDISYISRENRSALIHSGTKSYKVGYSLDELETIFSDFGLYRVHQSYLVPLSRIVGIQPDEFGRTWWAVLSDGKKVPVSQKKFPLLKTALAEYGIRFV